MDLGVLCCFTEKAQTIERGDASLFSNTKELKDNNRPASFDDLPDEIIIEIFQKLFPNISLTEDTPINLFNDLYQLGGVCCRFLNIRDDIIRNNFNEFYIRSTSKKEDDGREEIGEGKEISKGKNAEEIILKNNRDKLFKLSELKRELDVFKSRETEKFKKTVVPTYRHFINSHKDVRTFGPILACVVLGLVAAWLAYIMFNTEGFQDPKVNFVNPKVRMTIGGMVGVFFFFAVALEVFECLKALYHHLVEKKQANNQIAQLADKKMYVSTKGLLFSKARNIETDGCLNQDIKACRL